MLRLCIFGATTWSNLSLRILRHGSAPSGLAVPLRGGGHWARGGAGTPGLRSGTGDLTGTSGDALTGGAPKNPYETPFALSRRPPKGPATARPRGPRMELRAPVRVVHYVFVVSA